MAAHGDLAWTGSSKPMREFDKRRAGRTTDDATIKLLAVVHSSQWNGGTRDDSRGPSPTHTHGDRRSRDRIGGDETRLPHAVGNQPPAHRAGATSRNSLLSPDAQGHGADGSRGRVDRGRARRPRPSRGGRGVNAADFAAR